MKKLSIFLFISFICLNLLSQQTNFSKYSALLSPEKVYLHTDRDIYNASDTIWVSGYVENASYMSEFEESNYIYVELLVPQLNINNTGWKYNPNYLPTIAKRIKLKRIDNSFAGYIAIPEDVNTNKCILRGYTYWMLNRPVEYMFYKEIEIINVYKDDLANKLEEDNVKKWQEYAKIGEIPQNYVRQDTTIKDYDIQFLPEGGHCIAGEKNVIWVKAINSDGYGAKINGNIIDDKNSIITSFNTDTLGFGKIFLPNLLKSTMRAKISDSSGYEKEIQLPPIEASGVNILGNMFVMGEQQYTDNDRIVFEICATEDLLTRQLKAFIHNGSEIVMEKQIIGNHTRILVKLSTLMAGIHCITVIDANNEVYAQRTFLVLPTNTITADITTDKESYGDGQVVKCRVKAPYDSVVTRISVSVTDYTIDENTEKGNIESYFILKSELQGYIENIENYFNRDIPLKERSLAADMLMQTQGWRYYETPDIIVGGLQVPEYGKEYRQTLMGEVRNLVKLSNNTTVSFVAPSINFTAMGQVDSGYFILTDIDFPENTSFLVSAVGKNGRKGALTPTLYPDNFAKIHQYPISPGGIKYSKKFRDVSIRRIFGSDEEYAMSLELDPIVVTSTYITLKNSPSPNPFVPIKKDRIRDQSDIAPYAEAYDITSFVLREYPGIRFDSATLVGRAITGASMMQEGSRWSPIKIYLNNMPVPYSDIEHIPLSDVENMAYLEGLEASAHTGDGDISPVPILMIRTKPYYKSGKSPTNVSQSYPIGWQKPKKFYTPAYNVLKDNDKRVTLYWNPNIKLDQFGYAEFSFISKSPDDVYRIEVEGYSGYKNYIYGEKILNQ